MRTTQMYSRDVNTSSDIIPLEIVSTNSCLCSRLFLPCLWINIGMFSKWHDGQWHDMSRQCQFVFVTSLWSEYCGIVVDWNARCESEMRRVWKGIVVKLYVLLWSWINVSRILRTYLFENGLSKFLRKWISSNIA